MIDTACSSSLVAIHQAVQVLRDEVSRVAIAAGANLILDSGNFIAVSLGESISFLFDHIHSQSQSMSYLRLYFYDEFKRANSSSVT
jgi:acetyl-CoA acetyltransferase